MSEGKLIWGVKASFRDYVRRAEGETRLSDGVEQTADGVFAFPAGDEPLKFTGSVHFEAHGGMLKVTVSDPWVELAEDGTGVLTVANPGRADRLELATLGPATPSSDGTATATAYLSNAGSWLLGNVYFPKDELDPVTFPWSA